MPPAGSGKLGIGALRRSRVPEEPNSQTGSPQGTSVHFHNPVNTNFSPSAFRAKPFSAEEGQKAPFLQITLAGTQIPALLDTGANVCLLGDVAFQIAKRNRITIRPVNSHLNLAYGSTKVAGSLRLQIRWKGGSCRQRFLIIPGLNLQAILGRDFLCKQNISIHLSEKGWTLGTASQTVVPFDGNLSREIQPIPELKPFDLQIEREEPLVSHVNETTALSSELEEKVQAAECSTEQKIQLRELLYPFQTTFSNVPGLTPLIEHTIDTGNARPISMPNRPMSYQKKSV